MKEFFKSLADDLGLDFSQKLIPRKYTVSGKFRGHSIVINTKNREKRWTDIEFIQIYARLKNPKDVDFALIEQTAVSKAGKDTNKLDVLVDNPKFDGKYLIRCLYKKDAKKILTENIIDKILTYNEFNLQIIEGKAFMELSAKLANKERIKSKINVFLDIIENIDSLS